MNISCCVIAKNESHCIEGLLASVKPHVDELIVVDDSSTDNTVEIAKRYTDKVLSLPFRVSDSGFGEAATWMIQQATKEWILVIDADELIPEIGMLEQLTRYPNIDAWALPRRKWSNYKQQTRIEYDKYPDWQTKFFRNG